MTYDDNLLYKQGLRNYATDPVKRNTAYEEGYRKGVKNVTFRNGGGFGHPANQRAFNMGYEDGKADVQVFVHDQLFSTD